MPLSNAPYPKPSGSTSRPKTNASLMRDKNGCITCRVRQKKCTGVEPGNEACTDCIRLNIQCLGIHHNRPDWLRNPEALKETKYRIKHHLTEYPVPRGRGPAPTRPFLGFQDLIDKHSPRPLSVSGSTSPSLQSENLIRMEPDSPVLCTSTSQASGYLAVQTRAIHSNTPSPSTPYASALLTPRSSDGNLFTSSDANVPCGYPFQTDGTNEPVDFNTYEIPYIPQFASYAQPPSPYRHPSSQSLFLTSPVEGYPYQGDYQDSIYPRARYHY